MLPCHWISPFPWSAQDEKDLHPTHLFPLSDYVASLSIDAANWAMSIRHKRQKELPSHQAGGSIVLQAADQPGGVIRDKQA
ncbi:hypothetical protein HYQ46_009084 [Verticillium longisporum]|nr:hypothetical protein HYQ46_009084 [Verticillium longisporum]